MANRFDQSDPLQRVHQSWVDASVTPALAIATLKQAPTFVAICNERFEHLFVNGAGREMVGLGKDEPLDNLTVGDFFTPAHRRVVEGMALPALARDGQWERELCFRHFTDPSRRIDVRWSAFALRDTEGRFIGAATITSDVSARKRAERELRASETRLRAATELAGVGIYSWDPETDTLDWDERARAMWGVPPDSPVRSAELEASIHPEDLPRVLAAIRAASNPDGTGDYAIEYRVIGQSDGVERCISTFGRATFENGRAARFIGAAVDVTERRRAEAATRHSEERFRQFAEHSRDFLWIADPETGAVEYRSPAYSRIWGEPVETAPATLEHGLSTIHPDDRAQVQAGMASLRAGEAVQLDYRIIRADDGQVRWLRDTGFPIRDETGKVTRAGGIAHDLTRHEGNQVYLVGGDDADTRQLAATVRGFGFRVRIFTQAAQLLDVAPVLAPGVVLLDLGGADETSRWVARELKARSVALPTVLIGDAGAPSSSIIAAMRAGAIDYLLPPPPDDVLRAALAAGMAGLHGSDAATEQGAEASARVSRLTPREREVLAGLVGGGSNKSIGLALGISPRTVELHRANVMNRLNAGSLPDLIAIAIAAGVRPRVIPAAEGKGGGGGRI